jgi:hypothetical protein
MGDDLITVEYFADEYEAQLARGFLKNAGIKAFILYDAGGKYDPFGFFPIYKHEWISLKVRDLDTSRAIKLLQSKQHSSPKASADFYETRKIKLSFFTKVLITVGVIFLLAGPEQQLWFFIGIGFVVVGISLRLLLRYMKGNPGEEERKTKHNHRKSK